MSLTPPYSPRPSLDSSSLRHQSDTSPSPPPPSSHRPPSESLPHPSQHPMVSQRHPKDSALPDREPTEVIPTLPSSTRPSLDLVHCHVEKIQNFCLDIHDNHPTGRLEIKNVPVNEYLATEKTIGESRQRFWYNHRTKLIVVKAPPGPMHDGCLRILHLIRRSVDEVTQKGGFQCRVRSGPTGMLDIYDHANRIFIQGKEADGCLKIRFAGVESQRLPYLLIEIGYLDAYEQLVKEAHTWLTDHDRTVLTVIVVNISRSQASSTSDSISDWSGFVEVWERDHTGKDIHRSGQRVVFLPPMPTPAVLCLRLDQAIPHNLLPDNLKGVLMTINLGDVVEECEEALDWIKVCETKRKQLEPEGRL